MVTLPEVENHQFQRPFFGVKVEYLEASFDEMEKNYDTIENYFSEGLGIDATTQKALHDMYLNKK